MSSRQVLLRGRRCATGWRRDRTVAETRPGGSLVHGLHASMRKRCGLCVIPSPTSSDVAAAGPCQATSTLRRLLRQLWKRRGDEVSYAPRSPDEPDRGPRRDPLRCPGGDDDHRRSGCRGLPAAGGTARGNHAIRRVLVRCWIPRHGDLHEGRRVPEPATSASANKAPTSAVRSWPPSGRPRPPDLATQRLQLAPYRDLFRPEATLGSACRAVLLCRRRRREAHGTAPAQLGGGRRLPSPPRPNSAHGTR